MSVLRDEEDGGNVTAFVMRVGPQARSWQSDPPGLRTCSVRTRFRAVSGFAIESPKASQNGTAASLLRDEMVSMAVCGCQLISPPAPLPCRRFPCWVGWCGMPGATARAMRAMASPPDPFLKSVWRPQNSTGHVTVRRSLETMGDS